MADSSSLYGSSTPQGTVASSNYTTLYSGGNNFVPSGDNVIISGTLTVNGCAILTDCNAFSLLPANATTVNAFNAATAVSIGGSTGVTTIQNQLATGHYLFPLNDGAANQILTTNGSGVLSWTSISSLGVVTSITGTANQVIVSNPTGNVTLSLPQDIATTSNPVFAGVTGGNVTVGVSTDNTINTTTGDLIIDSATNLVKVSADLNVDNGALFVNATTNRVGINNNNPEFELHIDQGLDGLTQLGMSTIERTALWTLNDSDDLFSFSYGFPAGSYNRLQFNPTDQWFNTGKLGVATAAPAYTLDVGGDAKVTADLTVGSFLRLNGATSGYSTIIADPTGDIINYQLPAAQGASATVLTNNGTGVLSWAATGNPFNQSLNTTDDVEFNTVTTTNGLDSSLIYTDEIRSLTNGYVTLISPTGKVEIQYGETLSYPNGYMDFIVNSNYWRFNADGTTSFPNYIFPAADGSTDQMLITSGTGTLSWANRNPFDQSLNTTDNVEFASVKTDIIETVEVRPFDSATNTVRMISTGSGTYQTGKAEMAITESSSFPDGLAVIDVNSKIWYFESDGKTQFPFYTFPANDGTANQVLTTDGFGNLYWALPGGGGSTFGNITIAVDTDNTISTTTGNLVLDSASNTIDMNVATINTDATTLQLFTTNANNITIGGAGTNNSVTDYITLGASGKTYAVAVQALLTQQGITTKASSSFLNKTTTSPILIQSTTRTSMKGMVTITDDVTGAIHTMEFLANRKGLAGTPLITIYGEVYSDAPLATLTVVNGGSANGLQLYATLASTNSTDIYITRDSLGAVI